jgi:Ca-activated chloride channel family protein
MLALTGLLAVAGLCLAQDQPAFRAEVRLVTVSFTVRDAKGELVSGLTQDDVEVLDDGVAQPVSFFARGEDLPLALGLLVDMSGSQEHFEKRHRRDLHEFLKRVLSPRDQSFLVCFGNRLRLASGFTPSPDAILDGLKLFDKRPETMIEIGPKEHRVLGTAYFDALYYAMTDLLTNSNDRTRKALITFGDGEENSSAHHMLDVIETAQREDVVIFNIRYTQQDHGRLNARNKYGIRVMQRISLETGGADFDAQAGDLKNAFRAMGDQLRSSYELGYHAPSADGTFHKVTIRMKRPGLTVRAKSGYYARQ